MRRALLASGMTFVILLLLVQRGNACPSCYGAADAPMTDGMNMAILSLLGVTGGVLTAVASFFLYLKRRSAMLNKTFMNKIELTT